MGRAISRADYSYLDTLALWQTDPWLLLANDEDVAFSGSEGVVNGVLNVNDGETTVVSLTVSDDTNTTHVTTTSNHGDHTSVESDEIGDLASCKIDLDGVVDLDGRIGVSDTINPSAICFDFFQPHLGPTADRCLSADLRASIMRNQVWDSSFSNLDTLDLAEFVLCLGLFDSVHGEAALGVVDQTEVFASLVDRDDIHEASGIGNIGADLAINLDEALHQDSIGLTAVESILETISEENDQGQAIAGFLIPKSAFAFTSRGQLCDEREDQGTPSGHRRPRACPAASAKAR